MLSSAGRTLFSTSIKTFSTPRISFLCSSQNSSSRYSRSAITSSDAVESHTSTALQSNTSGAPACDETMSSISSEGGTRHLPGRRSRSNLLTRASRSPVEVVETSSSKFVRLTSTSNSQANFLIRGLAAAPWSSRVLITHVSTITLGRNIFCVYCSNLELHLVAEFKKPLEPVAALTANYTSGPG